MQYCYGSNFHYWFIFPIFWVIFLILASGFWWRRSWHKGYYSRHTQQSNENPLDIAKRRYAAGDINKEQYEQIKGDLK